MEVCVPLYGPAAPPDDQPRIGTPDVLLHFWGGEYRELDLRGCLPEIAVPTLVLAGASDPIVPAARSEAMAEGLVNAPEVSVCVFAGAGHGVYRNLSREFADAVAGFVGRLPEVGLDAVGRR